ncbi:hypothetical protein OS493_013532 [Desmophyllum pertusum]|uniref:Uncharacterized protein n=1 Tax=Desmophyllum pertusum TaxID=174260 RepID=A0A9X0D9W2_9CNID|nr:hypothetical protein OS493_013532 [Desmophyllum pertusum]
MRFFIFFTTSSEEKIDSFKNEINVLDNGESVHFECFTESLKNIDKLSVEQMVNTIPLFNRMRRKLELSCSIMQEKQNIVKWEQELEELTYKKGNKMQREAKMLASKRNVKYLRKFYEKKAVELGGKEAEEKVEVKAEELKINKVEQEKMDLD